MSLYSKNRISSISAEVVEERVRLAAQAKEAEESVVNNESAAPDVTDPQNEVTISESTYFNGIEKVNEFSNLIETNIQVLENDNNVFNSLLELDFVTSMNEAMMLESAGSEDSNIAKKKNILEQVNKICVGVKEALKQSGKSLKETSKAMISNDKKNFSTYLDAINKNGLEGFNGIKNFSFPSIKSGNVIDNIADCSDVVDAFESFCKSIVSDISKEDVDITIENFDSALTNAKNKYMGLIKEALPKSETWNPSDNDIKLLTEFVKGIAVTNSISETTSEVVDSVKSIEKVAKDSINNIMKEQGEFNVYKMDAVYRAVSRATRLVNNKFQAFRDLEVREIAAFRRAIFVCGKYAIKLEKSVKESVEIQDMWNTVVGESSDTYVFSKFTE